MSEWEDLCLRFWMISLSLKIIDTLDLLCCFLDRYHSTWQRYVASWSARRATHTSVHSHTWFELVDVWGQGREERGSAEGMLHHPHYTAVAGVGF